MSLLDRLRGAPAGLEPGDTVQFSDENGHTQHGTYEGTMKGGVLVVNQETGHAWMRGRRGISPEALEGAQPKDEH